MAALTFGPSRLREENESDEFSTQGRIYAWHAGFDIFKEHPISGCGVGQFTEYHHLTAHNSFVLCFAETGFVGYVLWLGTGAYAMYGLHLVMTRTRPGTSSYRQAVGLFDSLAAFYVGGFFLSRTYFLLLPVLLGLAVARYKMTRDELSGLPPDAALSDETYGDFVPQPEPIPELSWRSIPKYAPKLIGLAAGSMVLINIIVRIKLARG
jgi:putative inorganic carbon (hco3(-)) transporter